MTLKMKRVREIIDQFPAQRILVVGDLMLDRYIYGKVNRISPEAPVPVVQVSEQCNMPGGASNVAWNIQSLGGNAVVSGFMGTDQAADELKELLINGGVAVDGVVALSDVRTTVKTRIIAEHQQIVRVDWDNDPNLDEAAIDTLCDQIASEVDHATGVVIEDYGKGVVVQKVIDRVLKVAAEKGIPTGLDPKDNHELKLDGITVVTPNRREAHVALGMVDKSGSTDLLQDERLLGVGEKLLKKWNPELLMMTLGPQGMMLITANKPVTYIPTRAREVFDVSGAGDTVIAVCLLALACGASHEEAAELANYAAGVVVGKLGTATCSQDELMNRFLHDASWDSTLGPKPTVKDERQFPKD